jgi:hypothetical protein
MHELATSHLIEELSIALCGDTPDLRRNYLTRQTLLALVRQAKLETMRDMRANVARLTGMDAMALRRRHARVLLKGIADSNSRQQQFEFDLEEKKR